MTNDEIQFERIRELEAYVLRLEAEVRRLRMQDVVMHIDEQGNREK